MRLLILGGTIFYGRHVTEEALRRGHSVTLFNRGLHDIDFAGVTKLQGDRDGGLAPLATGEWDAVLDTSGYVPRVVRQSAELLKDRVKTYAFVSSISVFSDENETGFKEDGKVQKLEDATTEVVDGATYGGLKFLCEEVVREVYGDRAYVIRPGLIVGPYDSSDRFTYWPYRMSKGGEVVIPDRPEQAVQIIDARDLANWTLDMLGKGGTGTFDATGPSVPYVLEDALERIKDSCGKAANLVPIPPKFLEDQGVQPWTELPLSHGDGPDTLMRADVSNAVGAGLKFRSLEETARDTLEFAKGRGEDHPWRNGLPEEKEKRLLEAWRATSGTG